jgi:hypothetical protein
MTTLPALRSTVTPGQSATFWRLPVSALNEGRGLAARHQHKRTIAIVAESMRRRLAAVGGQAPVIAYRFDLHPKTHPNFIFEDLADQNRASKSSQIIDFIFDILVSAVGLEPTTP